MGPKRGGGKPHSRSGRAETKSRRDRGKTWDEDAENVEANIGRLKLENDLQEKEESRLFYGTMLLRGTLLKKRGTRRKIGKIWPNLASVIIINMYEFL